MNWTIAPDAICKDVEAFSVSQVHFNRKLAATEYIAIYLASTAKSRSATNKKKITSES